MLIALATPRTALAAAIVLLFPSIAGAQAFTPVNPEAPPTPGWVLTPSIGVGGAWDDNVLVVSPAEGPPGDYASPIRPSLGLDFTGKYTRFSAGYDGSVVLYRSLDELSSFEQHLRAAFSHRISRQLTVFGEESFTRAPTTDAIPLHGGVPFYRIGSWTNAIGGGFQAALRQHLSMRGSYTLRVVDFEFDEIAGRELQGGYAHEIDVAVERALSPRLTLGAEYGLDRIVMDGIDAGILVPVPAAAQQDRFSIQNASVTATYAASRTTVISGAFGIAHLGAGLLSESRTAPAWRGSITRRFERAVVTGAYNRSYVPSFGFGGTLQNEEWSGSVTVPFARNRAYATGSVNLFNNDALEEGQPRLKSLWLTSVIGYRISRWLRVEGFYNRTQQDTRREGGRVTRNQIGFQVVSAAPFRLH